MTSKFDGHPTTTHLDVKQLQDDLRELSYAIQDADGTLEESTRQALRDFQRDHGNQVTGEPTEETGAQIHALAELLRRAPEGEARERLREQVRASRVPEAARPPVNAAARERQLIVRGRVTNPIGQPLVRLEVAAFDKDMRTEQILGEAVTDANGSYEIAYTRARFRHAEKKSADLVVRVYGHGRAPLATSPLRFNARPVERVDLTIDTREGRVSEYESTVAEVTPLLQRVPLADLTKNDVDFLAGDTGLPAHHIAFVALANRHSAETRIAPQVFYALYRQDLPTALPTLAMHRRRDLRRALEASLRDYLIPAMFGDDIEATLDALQNALRHHALDGADGGASPVRGLLEAAGLSPELQETFLRAYVRHDGATRDFWKSLPDSSLEEKARDVQETLQLGLLTGNNVPLVKALRAEGVRSPKEVVRLGREGLRDRVASSKEALAAIPSADALETHQAKATRYADGVMDVLNGVFPTAFLAVGLDKPPRADAGLVMHMLSRNPTITLDEPLSDDIDCGGLDFEDRQRVRASFDALRREGHMFPGVSRAELLKVSGGSSGVLNNPLRQDVARFLSNVPEVELLDENIDELIAREGERGFAGVQDRAAVTTQLKRFQRVLRITSRHEHMEALMGEGLDSAHAMSGMSEAAFLDGFGAALGGKAEAKIYYAKSQQISGASALVATTVTQALNDVTPGVIGKPALANVKNLPNFATLFGSFSLCECKHCRSVYSPAAYLVDLLQFINPKAGPNALKALRARRPDLEHIPLTCENTNTPLPYLDLVNEILEFYVVHGALTKAVAHDTVSATAEELRVNPANTLNQAYLILEQAAGSPLLPFHRPLEVSRAYLQHLGSSRHEVMRTFRKDDTPSEDDLRLERLKISAAERNVLAGTDPRPLREFFGYSSGTGVFFDEDGQAHLEPWEQNLARVPEFLKRTGTTYTELVELLGTQFVNGTAPYLFLKEEGEHPHCDLTKTTIQHLSEVRMDRIHRFVRLRRKVEWTLPELDQALAVIAANDITVDAMGKLSVIAALEVELGVTLPVLLSVWAPLETRGPSAAYKTLYQKLFLNKAVQNPEDTDFELNDAGTDLSSAGTKTLSEKAAALRSALRLTAEDLAAVRTATGLSAESAPLSLANLSKLHRFVALARGLKLKIDELVSLLILTGMDPFEPAAPAATMDFVVRVRGVRRSGFSMTQLDYLLRHESEAAAALAPKTDAIDALTGELRDGLRKIALDTMPRPDPTGELLRSQLARVLDATLIEPAMAVIDGDPEPLDKAAFIAEHFEPFLDPVEATAALLNSSPPDTEVRKQRNRTYVLDRLMAYVREMLAEGFVVKTLSDDLGLESSMTALLVGGVLRAGTDPTKAAMADFRSLLDDGLSATYFSDTDLTVVAATRIDPTVQFEWAPDEAPAGGMAPAAFGARWTGKVLPLATEEYTLHVRVKDSVRLWVDGQLLIDAWVASGAVVEHRATILLEAGRLYDLRIDFFKGAGRGVAELSWSSPSTPKAPVPQTQLYSGSQFSFEAPMMSYRRLHKVALLVKELAITPKEMAHLSSHPQDFDGFDPNALPLDVGNSPLTLFQQWERLRDIFALRASLPAVEINLVDVFNASSTAEALQRLEEATGWSPEELDTLTGPGGFGLDDVADFRNEAWLLRLRDCLALSRRLGVSSERLFAWAASEPSSQIAKEIVNSAKAKIDPEQWPTAAKPLSDALREKQRSALVAHLLSHPNIAQKGIADTNQLFEYFLIDVDMSACQMTSRIKQAISSVQLFVQRSLMNLEPKVSPTQIDADQWEWMKSYRLWEANRKVFLYPENWILPELRDDKTPFFEELESQLLQNDIDWDTAENAFLAYLGRLDGVAKLDVCGMYAQSETVDGEKTDILHVFGRTPDPPHTLYYRQLVDGARWTPWEKVDVDVESDHLIPVTYNRRLYLFWPVFEERPDGKQVLDGPFIQSPEHWQWTKDHAEWRKEHEAWAAVKMVHDRWDDRRDRLRDTIRSLWEQTEKLLNTDYDEEGLAQTAWDNFPGEPDKPGEEPPEPTEPPYSMQPALTRWEIKLAWSEYRQGRWSPKQTSTEAVLSRFISKTASNFIESTLASSASDGFKEELLKDIGTTKNPGSTIVAVYLPEKETHFFRSVLDKGGLRIDVYRRYWRFFPILDKGDLLLRGYELLGHFRASCGARIKAEIKATPTSYQYTALRKPESTGNSFMRFRDQDPQALTFSTIGEVHQILRGIPPGAGGYDLLPPHQSGFALKPPFSRFFYQDRLKTYMATPTIDDSTKALRDPKFAFLKKGAFSGDDSLVKVLKASDFDGVSGPDFPHGFRDDSEWEHLLKFDTFFHPHLCAFLEALYRRGVPGLLERRVQELDNDEAPAGNRFAELYEPGDVVHWQHPREHVDFEGGAYSVYNWELFFHIPFLIAVTLSENQRFDAAQTWFHFIFNPTSSAAGTIPSRYWNTLPFFRNAHPEKEQIGELLSALGSKGSALKPIRDAVNQQIEAWLEDPFNPHLVARLRITAYQKNVVMRYVDNLVAWGDQLFGRDTMESINEATLLYVLAHGILGPRPTIVPSPQTIEPKTYKQLKDEGLDDFSNALVAFENEFPYAPPPSKTVQLAKTKGLLKKGALTKPTPKGAGGMKTAPETLYFCIPPNEELLKYWDTVEDRLFKIRHCMNIEGVVRELPLFEPPIDPGLLVKARAAGLDLGSVLSDINAPPPCYRFTTLLQKALEVCGEVKSLGGALLAAIEKKDAESLAGLRARQETGLLRAVREVKKEQIQEAERTLEGLRKSKDVIEARRDFYRDVVKINDYERENMDSLDAAHVVGEIAQGLAVGVSLAHMIPEAHIGIAGFSSPVAVVQWGGRNLGNALQAASGVLNMIATQHTHDATMASIRGGYERRWQDWKHQESLAGKELLQIAKQIAAAEIRVAISQKDLDNHEQQIENSAAVEAFLRDKYTNEALYGWMQGQISRMYFQAYKLAYDLAKRAEKAYRFERGLGDSNFVQFGHWDNLRRGLLAGESLTLDLKRMEAAYLEQNRREYELTKSISLSHVDPFALLTLKQTGRCELQLAESLFDMDHPGHYMRRIKSVSLTIPCVAGPYVGVHATLTLLKHETRVDGNAQRAYAKEEEGDDPRFAVHFAATQSIATSHAEDAGVFELNFRDERYLPFEGAGAISRWRIELPKATNAFDFDTISDVVLRLQYTARPGGDLLRDKALAAITAPTSTPQAPAPALTLPDLTGLARLFSARRDFPDGWYHFLHPNDGEIGHVFSFDLSADRFPLLFAMDLEVNALEVYLELEDGVDYTGGADLAFSLQGPNGPTPQRDLVMSSALGLPGAKLLDGDTVTVAPKAANPWSIVANEADLASVHPALVKNVTIAGVTHRRLDAGAIHDLSILCRYSAKPKPSA